MIRLRPQLFVFFIEKLFWLREKKSTFPYPKADT